MTFSYLLVAIGFWRYLMVVKHMGIWESALLGLLWPVWFGQLLASYAVLFRLF